MQRPSLILTLLPPHPSSRPSPFTVLVLIRLVVETEAKMPHAFNPLAVPSTGLPALAQSLICDGVPMLDDEYLGAASVRWLALLIKIVWLKAYTRFSRLRERHYHRATSL